MRATAADDNPLHAKRILITGAAGTIGRAICLELAQRGCAHLAMLDHADHGRLSICEVVARKLPSTSELLCDIRDTRALLQVMDVAKPDLVIHAAALKHVHLGERHPREAVLTNLLGVRNTLEAAASAGAKEFLLVSTDKAAEPTCIMGASKRLAELYLYGFDTDSVSRMTLRAVRFGNVYASQGSVVPRFAAQISAGGPVEITDPAMERYFLSLEAAVSICLDIATLHDHGRRVGVYFKEMGPPVRILELAENMIAEAGGGIEIVVTGRRAGEKFSEQLYDSAETPTPTALPHVWRTSPIKVDARVTRADLSTLETALYSDANEALRARLFTLLKRSLTPHASEKALSAA
ncbi:MAG: SDR family NAD(P)-dependent oxidoreductase [Caulobacterales bacterium]